LEVNVFDGDKSLEATHSQHKLSEEVLNRKKKNPEQLLLS